jgi:glycosyltransferase involved in cell wall biosynthesis
MKRLLLIHHTMQPPGGGSAVGAWALQALRASYEVTLLTWTPVDFASVNRAYGTDLDDAGIRVETLSPLLRGLLETVPARLALLSMNLLFRKARSLQRLRRFDVIVCTNNEIEVGVPVIQYVHYPWAALPRPDEGDHWYHITTLLGLYRGLCKQISGFRKEPVSRNRTLVNSDWTGAVFQGFYGVPVRTLYPPVPGGFPQIPFAERDDGFVCLGRLSREKEIEKLIDILVRVRARGHAIRFHIVGHIDVPVYARRLYRAAKAHGDWLSFHHDLPRDTLAALVTQNRYGIHGMVGEHFGIAPAELQKAGCITFVPDDGGPVEIVGHDERVIYHSVDDAVEKIDRMLCDADLRTDVLRAVADRASWFSETRFMAEILEAVEDFESSSLRPSG